MSTDSSATGSLLPDLGLPLPQASSAALQVPRRDSSVSGSKIDKAAKDFETILLSQWLEQAREAFAGVPGGDEDDADDPGASAMSNLGMESLAAAITRAGGLGIAHVIAGQLKRHEVIEAGDCGADKQPTTPQAQKQTETEKDATEESLKKANQITRKCR